jgi:hypothetical protein
MNEIALTASEDRERSGLGGSTGVIAEQQSKTLASGDGNSPGERGTGQTIPGEECGSRRGVTRVDALHTRNAGESTG